MKVWMWESDWKGINFTELGIKLTFFKRASQDFYTAFYKTLFEKYKHYDEIMVSASGYPNKNEAVAFMKKYENNKNYRVELEEWSRDNV